MANAFVIKIDVNWDQYGYRNIKVSTEPEEVPAEEVNESILALQTSIKEHSRS